MGLCDADTGYYWVPGAWVMAPEPGALRTPGYWGWGGNGYAFNEGYRGLNVGFYGGISYGFGYFGEGFQGGRWQGGQFFYNRSVSNVNVTNMHNVYNTTITNTTVNRVSYNGGTGGIDRRPTAQEQSFSHERHVPPVTAQNEHVQAARSNPEQRASAMHASPALAAARPENARPENAKPETATTRPVVHPNDLPARQPYTAPNTGNTSRDKKLQQGHDQMIAKQDTERQHLQQKQDQEHQKQATQKTSEAGKQQLEQQHQQQTQKLQQKHTQQEQKMQSKAQPASPKHA